MDRERLISAGIDYDEGVERFAGMAQIYEKYLVKFFDSYGINELISQINAGDIETAFKTAHAIKGAAGNLSINLFYEKLCVLVELLRRSAPKEECAPLIGGVRKQYEIAADAVREGRQ
ncbi:MAG: hypothetical protein PHI27_07300 [Eubacteriales bacterium]|nr:hypothetical protein [Eubacteriales bacterium]MDD3882042.1 hypothetical protein [Eubacteriales bacterium]MDD4512489.1 hypothetical protein [Eubacteriales bacterium]